MEQILKNAFRTQIQSKEGFDFEDFIDELYLLKCGADDYLPIRASGDKGNDGTIISDKKVLACYAPKSYDKKEFEDKVNGTSKKVGDFKKYKDNWESTYPNWEMHVNHDITPDQLKLINNLDGNTSIKGVAQIISIIENDLTSNKRRKLASYLGIENFFIQDYIEDIINDLLHVTSSEDKPLNFDSKTLIPPQKKIELNFKKEDWDGINSEMILVMEEFMTITKILSGYDDSEINTLKSRIINDYNKLSGVFKNRLYNLTEQYTREYGNIKDDEYLKCVKSILLYMFEQCLIGKKTTSEL